MRLFPLYILDLFTGDEINFFAYFIALIIQVQKITYLSNMFYTRNSIQQSRTRKVNIIHEIKKALRLDPLRDI